MLISHFESIRTALQSWLIIERPNNIHPANVVKSHRIAARIKSPAKVRWAIAGGRLWFDRHRALQVGAGCGGAGRSGGGAAPLKGTPHLTSGPLDLSSYFTFGASRCAASQQCFPLTASRAAPRRAAQHRTGISFANYPRAAPRRTAHLHKSLKQTSNSPTSITEIINCLFFPCLKYYFKNL